MKKVCIFGAASEQISQTIKWEMKEIGKLLASQGHMLIFGAGSTGVMGAVYEGYINNNPYFKPFGSTTKCIESIEKPCEDIHLIRCNTMKDRKELYWLADVFIVMPGGVGTLDELFEFLTLKKLGFWNGDIYLYKPHLGHDTQYKLIWDLLRNMEDMKVLRNLDTLIKSLTLETLVDALHTKI